MDGKLAQTSRPLHELLQKRWSPRAFSDKRVEIEKLQSLFEAARWSASCFNAQPWYFLIASRDHTENFKKMLGCLVEKNQQWAKTAPVLILAVAKLNFDHNGKTNRHAFYDTGQAAAQMAIQATALGLYIHQMAGFDTEKTIREFSIPEGFQPAAAIAVGYLGDPGILPESFQESEKAPRQRKDLKDFIFETAWAKPWKFSESGC